MRRAVLICLVTAAGVAAAQPATALGAPECDREPPIAATVQSLPGAKARAKAKAITLSPDAATEVVNFGPRRGTQEIDIVLNAGAKLPRWFTAGHLEVDIPRRLRRVGDNLESVTGSFPRLSKPRISGRKRVTFTICVDGNDLPAGRYAGLVTVDGPGAMESTAVGITANAKNGKLWWAGFIASLVIAFLVLGYRGASERLAKTGEHRWRRAAGSTIGDPTWWASTVVSLGAAFGTVYAIYAGNPAWGEDGPAAVFALIGATLTAAGVQSFLTTFRKAEADT